MAPEVIETVAQLRQWPAHPRRAVVMTMGALHEGHRQLMRSAREWAGPEGQVLVTIFVNPLQFGEGEDFERYPRTWEADLAVCQEEGVAAVFAPLADDVYGAGREITVDPGPLGEELEGASRPGHFRGVLTVVAKILLLAHPQAAFFGEKDYQQFVLIRRMTEQLQLPFEVRSVPTVREEDGLARSSRNRYLDPQQRQAAVAISAALATGAAHARDGATAALAAARQVLASEASLVIDYLVVRDPELGAVPDVGSARMLIAAYLGETRLIDNIAISLGQS
ncbi:MAG: pantoate--beta-alanine ligase [Actinomycetia bacterium]|nr:pantoate--beta-alanine ligase [Actinomycetes bacterium]MCH9801408.1 pantoate--beta-alanine ligase [Actinomycetes bacterium]